MSFKIDRGLFRYDFIDHHAVLCVPIDADGKEIRKRYLKVARRLHPDSCATATPEEKQQASQLLSKLVNPAYEKLSADRSRTEYMVLLSQMGKRLLQEPDTVILKTDLALRLAQAPTVDNLYRSAINKLAATQYDSLEQALQIIAQISELNLVYLLKTANRGVASAPPPPPAPGPQQPPAGSTASPTTSKYTPASLPTQPAAPQEESIVGQYLRRAQTLIGKNQFAAARVELQDALKIEPNNSRCHSMLGFVYFKLNQLKMAKVHFDRALALNPKDDMALKGKRVVEKELGIKPGTPTPTASANPAPKSQPKSEGGGLFGGLFGGKKK
ncbi:MAG: tetratricopeptide repeat protein [Nostocaceae cyanobacterium]|nr:tetratricopeptide repeat protein [Nostocaceae cyanobacterium]